MKFSLTLFVLLSITYSTTFSIERYDIAVGKQPYSIYSTGNELYGGFFVFCLGFDEFYDTVMDENDQKPSCWYIPGPKIIVKNQFNEWFEEPKRIAEFDFGFLGLHIRPAFDYSNNLLYFSHYGKIRVYRFNHSDSLILIDSSLTEVNASSIAISGDFLYFTISPYGMLGSVYKFNYKTKQYTDTIRTGYHPSQIIVYDNNKIAILSEGNYGQNDGMLQFIDVSGDEHLEISKLENLGKGANNIFRSGNNIFVAMNGDSKVIEVDISTNSIVKTIDFKTENNIGIRELFYDEIYQKLYATSWDGHVYLLNKNGNYDSLSSHGKTEGIYVRSEDYFVVTNPFIKESLDPDSIVSIFFTYSTVDQNDILDSYTIYPNPVNDMINLRIGNKSNNISKLNMTILDIFGREIVNLGDMIISSEIFNNSIDISPYNLSNGTYYLKLSNNGINELLKFNIIK